MKSDLLITKGAIFDILRGVLRRTDVFKTKKNFRLFVCEGRKTLSR